MAAASSATLAFRLPFAPRKELRSAWAATSGVSAPKNLLPWPHTIGVMGIGVAQRGFDLWITRITGVTQVSRCPAFSSRARCLSGDALLPRGPTHKEAPTHIWRRG